MKYRLLHWKAFWWHLSNPRVWNPSPLHLERLSQIPSEQTNKLGYWMHVLSHFSHVQHCATLWTVAYQAPLSMDSPGKNTGVGCHVLLQGIFPTVKIKPMSLMSPALAGRFSTTSTAWEAQGTQWAGLKIKMVKGMENPWSHGRWGLLWQF